MSVSSKREEGVWNNMDEKEVGLFENFHFPAEIQQKILSYLDPSIFYNVSLAFTNWNDMIHEISWRSVSKVSMKGKGLKRS